MNHHESIYMQHPGHLEKYFFLEKVFKRNLFRENCSFKNDEKVSKGKRELTLGFVFVICSLSSPALETRIESP